MKNCLRNKSNLKDPTEVNICPTEDTTGNREKLLEKVKLTQMVADGDVHIGETTLPTKLKVPLELNSLKAKEDATEVDLVEAENGDT
jgi:hypothetical protein